MVIWVSGCSLNCPGCIAKELQDKNNGIEYKDFFKAIKPYFPYIDGVTFSGGEPLQQPKELLELLEKIPHLDKMLYTGYYYHELTPIQKECFNKFDLVVEGRFEFEKRGNFLWRGSSNQIFSSPTKKYSKEIINKLYLQKSGGLKVKISNNKIYFYGIPTKQNEIEKLKKQLKNKNIKVTHLKG